MVKGKEEGKRSARFGDGLIRLEPNGLQRQGFAFSRTPYGKNSLKNISWEETKSAYLSKVKQDMEKTNYGSIAVG